MALEGTIKDFALPDIFQLIGIQRKTGVLTLENGDDTVTLQFLNGEVVGADTKTASIEERLGELLVRTGRITEAQLRETLRLQKNTLQRLGYILVQQGHISEDGLVEALRVQSSQIIYRLFRWREGRYHFDRVENLEYDQNHFTPMSSETILMEGARMMDEWPIIERRIKSDRMILRKTEAARALDLGSLLDGDVDLDLGYGLDRPAEEEVEGEAQEAIKVSAEEREILALVDGKRTVAEITDLLTLGDFDTCRLLSDLLTRNLIEEVGRQAAREPERTPLVTRVVSWAAHGVVLALVVLALAGLPRNPLTPWRLLAGEPATGRFQGYASMARLEKIDSAIQVFYLDAGTIPETLGVLAQTGYLRPADLIDPWGRPYLFRFSPGGYQLQGLDRDGRPREDLMLSKSFSDAQRLMLSGGGAAPSTGEREAR